MSARLVLLVDDDSTWCEQVCRLLASSGYEAFTANSETTALEILSRMRTPCAILVDPNTADRAFCRVLRGMPELNGVPLYLVSASSAGTIYDRTVANGYVRKAVALDHLMLMIGTAPIHQHNDGGTSSRRAA